MPAESRRSTGPGRANAPQFVRTLRRARGPISLGYVASDLELLWSFDEVKRMHGVPDLGFYSAKVH